MQLVLVWRGVGPSFFYILLENQQLKTISEKEYPGTGRGAALSLKKTGLSIILKSSVDPRNSGLPYWTYSNGVQIGNQRFKMVKR
jgi:hypothetical protein